MSGGSIRISRSGTFALVTDTLGNYIRMLTPLNGMSTLYPIAGSGSVGVQIGAGPSSSFYNPLGLALDPTDSYAIICDEYWNRIVKIDLGDNSVSLLAGSIVGSSGYSDALSGSSAGFYWPIDVSFSLDGTYVLVTELLNCAVRRIEMSAPHAVTTLSGIAGSCGSAYGKGSHARYNGPHGIDVSPDGSYFLVADRYNNLIKKLDTEDWSATAIGFGVALNQPCGLSISSDGSYALIANFNDGNIIKMLLPSGSSTVLVSSLNEPHAVDISGATGLVFPCAAGSFSSASGVIVLCNVYAVRPVIHKMKKTLVLSYLCAAVLQYEQPFIMALLHICRRLTALAHLQAPLRANYVLLGRILALLVIGYENSSQQTLLLVCKRATMSSLVQYLVTSSAKRFDFLRSL
jgi:hypothetical protein